MPDGWFGKSTPPALCSQHPTGKIFPTLERLSTIGWYNGLYRVSDGLVLSLLIGRSWGASGSGWVMVIYGM